MAVVIVHTTLPIEDEMDARVVEEICSATTSSLDLDSKMRTVFLNKSPESQASVSDSYQTVFFVYSAPGKSVDNRRRLVRAYNDLMDSFDWDKPSKVVVVVKEHEADFVGANGVLRADVTSSK